MVLSKETSTWEARHAAVIALGMVNWDPKAQAPPQVVNALFTALKDPAIKVRLAALRTMQILRIPEIAAMQVPFQVEVQKLATGDPDPVCKIRAHMAIYPLHRVFHVRRVSLSLSDLPLDN